VSADDVASVRQQLVCILERVAREHKRALAAKRRFAVFDPHLPHAELPKLWAFPVDHFVAASGAPTGWGWLQLVHKSDYLIFIAVAALGLITVVCYARIQAAPERSTP